MTCELKTCELKTCELNTRKLSTSEQKKYGSTCSEHNQLHVPGRRSFLQASSMLLGAACSYCAMAPAHAKLLDYKLAASEIAKGTWAVHGAQEYFNLDNGGNIVNIAFIEVPDGVVVIDTGPSKRYGEALLELINRTIPNKPVLRVYNTHHHPDHCFGNQVFDSSVIAAPQGVIDNLTLEGDGFAESLYRLVGDWMRGTTVALPGVALDASSEDIGGRKFSLFYLEGHTNSDFVVRDDETGVLFTGDLAFMFRTPTTPHADIATWQASISALGGTDRELIFPGHGPQDKKGDSLTQTADYLAWLDNTMRGAVEQGLTMNEAMVLPIPNRFNSLSVLRTEFERSVVHLYPTLEDTLMPEITVTR